MGHFKKYSERFFPSTYWVVTVGLAEVSWYRGWGFDDLEEATGISEETHWKFLHLFLVWWSSFFFEENVIAYDDNKIIESCVNCNLAGFPGCVGSGDATHVGLLKCYYKLEQ